MSLEALPVELLHRICSYCDTSAIKSIRLSSTYLAAIADEHLLEEAHVYWLRDSFANLGAICSRPSIARNVRSLCIEGDRLWHHQDFQEWNKFQDPPCEPLPNPNSVHTSAERRQLSGTPRGRRLLELRRRREEQRLRDIQLNTAYKTYLELINEYEEMRHDGTPQAAMQEFFETCPKLDTVVLTLGGGLRPTSHKSLQPFQHVMSFPSGDSNHELHGSEQLLELLRAVSSARASLQTVRVASVSVRFFTEWQRDSQLKSTLTSLRNFHLQIHTPDFPRVNGLQPPDGANSFFNLFRDKRAVPFFASMPNLRNLKLVAPFTKNAPGNANGVSLSDLLGDITWPHLEGLHLEEFTCTQVSLLNLLHRHSSTLQQINLVEAALTDYSSWLQAFVSIAGSLPHLQRVRLRGNFGTSRGRSLVKYFGQPNDDDPTVKVLLMQAYLVQGGQLKDFFNGQAVHRQEEVRAYDGPADLF